MDNRRAPSAETKKHLTKIECCARRMIESLVGANDRTVDAIAVRVGPVVSPITTGSREELQKFLNFASRLKLAAHDARASIDRPKEWSRSAPRVAAMQLRLLFSHHSLKFSATADGYGSVSPAVEALLNIAHKAGDLGMTLAAARKWIELVIKLSPERYLGKRSAEIR